MSPLPVNKFDAIVLGAGAAGLMCAIEAGKRGRRVAVLERAEKIGKKILISGGGRCNFTNIHCRPEHFVSSNPHFCKSALSRYTPGDFIALVEKHGIPYHEKTLGQLFCDHSAREIVAMLEQECSSAGVKIFTSCEVETVEKKEGFIVRTASAEFCAPALVIATGGLSIPKIGATGFGYEVARHFGINIVPCRPGLVPMTFNAVDLEHYGDLAGVAADAEVSAAGDKPSFREKILITHRGLSGPAALQISTYWNGRGALSIDLAPGREVMAPLLQLNVRRDVAAARALLREVLPKRLADRWLEVNPPPDWTNRGIAELERRLHRWKVMPAGTEGYEKAEVTAGGIDTDELSAKTMESRRVPGLFFIGEVVDVTGHLGGFNFQWAWSSGFCAGQAL